MQKERLTNDFTTALNQFQRVQREAVTKERESVQRVRTMSSSGMGTSGGVMVRLYNSVKCIYIFFSFLI